MGLAAGADAAMSTTIATEDLSTTIVLNQVAAGLANAAAGADPLTDPRAAERLAKGSDAAPFVNTSWPDRNPFYPMIVAEEAGSDLDRIDRRADLQGGGYDIGLTIFARTQTEMYKIRDQTKKWFVDNVAALHAVGIVEVRLVSSTSESYDSSSRVHQWRLVYRSLVHTT